MIDILIVVTRCLEKRHSDWVKGERERLAMVDKPSPAARAKSMSKR